LLFVSIIILDTFSRARGLTVVATQETLKKSAFSTLLSALWQARQHRHKSSSLAARRRSQPNLHLHLRLDPRVDRLKRNLTPCLAIIRKSFTPQCCPFSPSERTLLTRSCSYRDLVMCRKQAGIAIGRLCDKCDGKCPVCDGYVRPTTLVRICDECSFGNYQNKCVVCGGEVRSHSLYPF
jgi:PHF5-like protein